MSVSRATCHESGSHTVMSGAATGAKVSGVPEVPPVDGEAPPAAQSIVATDGFFKWS